MNSNPEGSTLYAPGPIPSIQVSNLRNQRISSISAPQASSSSYAIPTQPSITSIEEIQSNQPKWSVSHNPKIKQALHIDLAKTFDLAAEVFCVKFSPDGKYLAVGLGEGNGRTCIYYVEDGSKIWLVPSQLTYGLLLTFRASCLVDLYLKEQPIVWCVQFSPDNKYIATASDGLRVCSSCSSRQPI